MTVRKPEGPYYTPREVARELNMDIYQLYTMIEKGKIHTLRTYRGKRVYHWIHKDELERLKREKNSKNYYTTTEVAKILQVSWDRVYNWIRKGKLRAVQSSRNKRWRIPKDVVQMLLKAKQLPREQLYTTSQLAKTLNISKNDLNRLFDLILSGKIQGVGIGWRWYIPEEELEKAKKIMGEEYGEKILHH